LVISRMIFLLISWSWICTWTRLFIWSSILRWIVAY
jgi:hypothetical protein